MSEASVVCQLCNARVSVRAGNLNKLQLHVERSHDVFQDQDIVMALSFLDYNEKEVIIDQVIPRIKTLLDKSKTLDCSEVINTDLLLQEKLETLQKESEIESSCVEASTNDTDFSNKQFEEMENLESLTENIEEDDNIENMTETVEITKMVHYSDVNEKVAKQRKQMELDAKVSKCYICNLSVKKYKLIKHRRNCQILKQKKLYRGKEDDSQELNKLADSSLSLGEEQKKKDKFYCDFCPKHYDHRTSLNKHKKKCHT